MSRVGSQRYYHDIAVDRTCWVGWSVIGDRSACVRARFLDQPWGFPQRRRRVVLRSGRLFHHSERESLGQRHRLHTQRVWQRARAVQLGAAEPRRRVLALQARGWKPPLLLRAAAQHVRSAAPRAVASTPPCTENRSVGARERYSYPARFLTRLDQVHSGYIAINSLPR